MSDFLQKHVPISVEGSEYDVLRQRVLRRDGWRCQFCGTMTNLEVHHQQFRSHAGEDTEQNLITLCASCHSLMHSIVHAKCKQPSEDRMARAAGHEADSKSAGVLAPWGFNSPPGTS